MTRRPRRVMPWDNFGYGGAIKYLQPPGPGALIVERVKSLKPPGRVQLQKGYQARFNERNVTIDIRDLRRAAAAAKKRAGY